MRPQIAPVTAVTGGTSESKPDAGSDIGADPTVPQKPITTADQAGAAILTVICAIMVVGGSVWLIM
jgi:hypothetical protein